MNFKKLTGSREFLLFIIVIAMFAIVSLVNPVFFSFSAVLSFFYPVGFSRSPMILGFSLSSTTLEEELTTVLSFFLTGWRSVRLQILTISLI